MVVITLTGGRLEEEEMILLMVLNCLQGLEPWVSCCAAWIQCCWLVKRSVWWGPRGWSQCENRYGIYLSKDWQQMSLGSNETSCKSDIDMRYNSCSIHVCLSARNLNSTFNPLAQPGIFLLVVYALAFLDFKIWL